MRYKPLIYISLIIAAFAFVIIGCGGGGGDTAPPDDGNGGADTTAPSVHAALPADSATDVPINANLVMTFDEAVSVGTGNVYIYDDTDTLFNTVNVDSAQVTGFDTETIVIDPDPVEDFAQSTGYYILIDAGAFTDASNNSFAGITDKAAWSFQTGTVSDITPPAVSDLFPTTGAIDIALNASLVINFDEAVIAGTGNVSIYDLFDTLFEAIDVSSDGVTGFGTDTVIIDPSVDFAVSTGYYVQINAGSFKDTANIDYAGIADTTTWTFTTGSAPDSSSPLISVLTPADDETAALPAASLIITFDEAVIAGEGMVTIYDSGDTLFEAIDVASSQVTGFGTDTVTIDPTDDFLELTDYYVLVDPGAFSDTAGNDFAGVTDTASWNFGVKDDTPPTLVKVYPIDGVTAVPWNANLILVFSEAVDAGTGYINVYDSNNTLIEQIDVTLGQVTGFGTDTIFVDRSNDLSSGLNHYVQIDDTAFVDTSPAANPYAGIADTTTWSFTAGVGADTDAPIISSQIPTVYADDVPTNTNLKITFDEVVFVGSGDISIYDSGDTLVESIAVDSVQVTGSWADTITIDPADFPGTGAAYWVEIPDTAFYDISGNYFAGQGYQEWYFTTGDGPDTTPPAITDTGTDLDPYAGEEDVVLDTDLSITFDDTVYAGSGSISIYDSGDTLIESIAVDSAQVTGLGTATIALDPAADFDGLTGYYVHIDATAFKDIANNYFAGITDSVTWSFTTEIGDLLGGVESFDYGGTSADLDDPSLDSNWTEVADSPTTTVQYVDEDGYTYAGYSEFGAAGKATGQNDATGGVMKRYFIATADKNAVYLGFIVAGITHPESSSGFGVAFHNTDGIRLGGIYFVGGASAGLNERYTIQLSDGTTTLEIADKRKSGTAYLVVVKYDFSTDTLSAFLDPDVTLAEPVSDTSNSFTVSSSWTDIDSIVLDESWQSGDGLSQYDVDEIKVVKSWGLLAE